MATGRTSVRREPRAVIRDFPGLADVRVEFDPRPAYDFALALDQDADIGQELLPEDRRWLAQARGAIASVPRRDAAVLFGSERTKGLVGQLPAILVARPDVRNAADLVAAVDGADRSELFGWLLAGHHGELSAETDELVGRAAAGETVDLRALRRQLPDYSRGAIIALLADPDRWLALVRELLRAWLREFASIEPRVAAMQERDVASRRAAARRLGAVDLIEQTTGGIRWLPEPRIRRVLLAPSYFVRPANHLFSGEDWRLFCYPIADEALDATDPSAPPQAAIRLYRALGDETRMRILGLLTKRDHYLTELAQLLELSKPTIKHHLVQLRAAGLVTVTDEGALSYYSLRRERLDEVHRALRGYLGISE